MQNNFDLKKYLIENKLTPSSQKVYETSSKYSVKPSKKGFSVVKTSTGDEITSFDTEEKAKQHAEKLNKMKFIPKEKFTKLSEEEDDWTVSAPTEWGKREPKDAVNFYNNVKPGQKVRYAGLDKNGFKHGEYYEVDHVKSTPSFRNIVVLKNGGRKLIVKGTNSIQ